jgi:hypothetical protein
MTTDDTRCRSVFTVSAVPITGTSEQKVRLRALPLHRAQMSSQLMVELYIQPNRPRSIKSNAPGSLNRFVTCSPSDQVFEFSMSR